MTTSLQYNAAVEYEGACSQWVLKWKNIYGKTELKWLQFAADCLCTPLERILFKMWSFLAQHCVSILLCGLF